MYQKELDKKISEVHIPTSETSGIIVGLYSYNQGDPSIRFSGWFTNKENKKQFCKANLKVKFIEKITKAMEELYNEFKQKSLPTPEQSFEVETTEDDMPF